MMGKAVMGVLCLKCLGPCFATSTPRSGHRDSLQYTNDGFQNEADAARGRRWNDALPRRSSAPSGRGRVIPLERRSRHCSSCGVYANHVPKGSPAVRSARGRQGDSDDDYSARSILSKQRRKEGQKTVWFKESEDSSDIEVEIIPDSVGRVEEEPEEEPEGEMDDVVRDPAAPLREENQNPDDQDQDNSGPDTEKEKKKHEG